MDYQKALKAWHSLLGNDYVHVDVARRGSAETATFATQQRIPAIVQPANRQEVQECLRIANLHQIPVYTVSSGKNWGYGSRVPVETGCVLLDLSRLNAIVDFDEELAYVTVQPGVTQRQLFDFLKERKSNLWMDATGSSPDCSLIGNVMERGFGHTPYSDHFAQVCALEVVLATGECIHTGFRHFPNAAAAPVYRWGMGPVLDGLFSQSNFGIVTEMTIWLLPAPEYFASFSFAVATDAQLAPLIDALRPLRLNGTIRSAVHIANSYKALASTGQYPWDEAGGRTPLPIDVLAAQCQANGFMAWQGGGGLYGSRAQVRAGQKVIRAAIHGKVDRLQWIDDRKLGILRAVARPLGKVTGRNIGEMLKLIAPVYGLMKGIPTESSLASAYWRKRTPVPVEMNPDRDGCGLIWLSPVAPLAGRHAMQLNDVITETTYRHQLEPIISLTLLTERSLGCVIALTYDRDVSGEDVRAMACYHDLLSQLSANGYYPYRLGIQSQSFDGSEPDYAAVLRRIKQVLDPNLILAPGRYEPASTTVASP